MSKNRGTPLTPLPLSGAECHPERPVRYRWDARFTAHSNPSPPITGVQEVLLYRIACRSHYLAAGKDSIAVCRVVVIA